MIRGVIEGFYGPPWSHEERLDLIAFCGRHGLDTYVWAPKDDPLHRERWRDPHPDAELERFAGLVRAGERAGVDVVYAISPALSVRYSDPSDEEALLARIAQLREVGVRSFHVLYDDVEHELEWAPDVERYGGEERPIAAAQADLANRVHRALPDGGSLVVCPRGYAGTTRTPYRSTLGRLLDPAIGVYWTGPEVCSLAISRLELDAAALAFGGRDLLVWDNYPVNDWDPTVLHLAPYRGREPALVDGPLSGVVANGMVQAVPSRLALATFAEWARDPAGYDPVAAFERALAAHGAEVLDALGGERSGVTAPEGLGGLIAALTPGVDAPTARTLLEPFV